MPTAYAIRRSYVGGRTEINHVSLFTAGFLAYWMLPVGAVLLLGSQIQDIVGSDLINMYLRIDNIGKYLIICEVIYLSFLAGDLLGRKQIIRPLGKIKPISESILYLFSVAGAMIAAFAIFQARGVLFGGAYGLDPDLKAGAVSASCVFLIIPAIINAIQTRPDTLKQLFFNRYMILFWPVNLCLILSGGRLYFISFMLMLLIYWTYFVGRLRVARIALFFIALLALMGLVGAYRLGGGSVNGIAANLLTEPMFTSFSLVSFLGLHKFYLWNYPTYLGGDLINLIPSAILPGKVALMSQMKDIYSPLGAFNSFVSFQYNFGVIGTMIFMFALGYLLSRFRRRANLWSNVAYILISGWLPFTFFRDPFSVSLIKNILEFSIIIPAVIIVTSRFVGWVVRSQSVLSVRSTDAALISE
jgi:hypothetical protein